MLLNLKSLVTTSSIYYKQFSKIITYLLNNILKPNNNKFLNLAHKHILNCNSCIYIDMAEKFPRFEITRKVIRGKEIKYFGPFATSGKATI